MYKDFFSASIWASLWNEQLFKVLIKIVESLKDNPVRMNPTQSRAAEFRLYIKSSDEPAGLVLTVHGDFFADCEVWCPGFLPRAALIFVLLADLFSLELLSLSDTF